MSNQIKISLQLYSTLHCHLCEQAQNLLQQVEKEQSIIWQFIDIAEDDKLLLKYETKIPVLKREDNNTELLWPFTHQEIKTFIT
jgi:hypothetical protein